MDGVGARTVGGATLTGRWSRIGGLFRNCASISRSRSIMLEICAAIGSTITSTPLVTKSALVIEFSQSQHHPMLFVGEYFSLLKMLRPQHNIRCKEIGSVRLRTSFHNAGVNRRA